MGTVQRYQGDEKSLMIIDIPDFSVNRYAVGMFLQAELEENEGSKLFNVAVSRAKNSLGDMEIWDS